MFAKRKYLFKKEKCFVDKLSAKTYFITVLREKMRFVNSQKIFNPPSDATSKVCRPCGRSHAEHPVDANFRPLHIPVRLGAGADPKNLLGCALGAVVVPVSLPLNEPCAKHRRSH